MKHNIQWIKLVAYALVLILLNNAASTLFFRIDLTRNKTHSLSKASIDAVANLEEPLTIKAFFSENLPSPYNNLEQEVGDLLEAYGFRGNKFFNYSMHTIGTEREDEAETSKANRTDAQSYGVFPIQIQKIEADEVKLVSAFMGMVFIQGDLIETIPVLNSGENKEMIITSTIKKMSDKTGAILAMDDDIALKLYHSSALGRINASLADYPDEMSRLIKDLNRQYYDRLDFRHIDPENLAAGDKPPEEYNLSSLNLQLNNGESQKVYSSLVVENNQVSRKINLFRQNIFGGQTIEDPQALVEALPGVIDTLVGINPKIGFLTDHGALSSYGGSQDPATPGLNNLRTLLSENYDLVDASIEQGIPDDISILLVVSPQGTFTEWELFQLDQYLMKGNSIAFFIDSMTEIAPQGGNQYYGQPPTYIPRNTGLEPLLTHFGLKVENSYILDENCFVRTEAAQGGGVNEMRFYFAPFIEKEDINKESVIMGNIQQLLLLNNSPITVNTEAPAGLAPQVVFSSSSKAWEMKEDINLYNPTMIYPPAEDERKSMAAAAFVTGSMMSYFKDRSIPQPPEPTEEVEEGEDADLAASFTADQAQADLAMIESGAGKLFLIGSSTLLKDNILDANGNSTNATFLLNLIDFMGNREDYAKMRSKGQSFSPLKESSATMKRLIKGFNIAGLPIIVILLGLFIWLRNMSRRKRIAQLFSRETE